MISCSYKQDSRRIQLYDLSYRLKNLTDAEVEQLEAIGDTTISSAQWGYLGAMDQGVATTDNVTHDKLSLSNQSGCSVTLSADQAVATATYTVIIFDTENYDKQNEYDTTNGKFTAATSGRYLVCATLRYETLGDGDYVRAAVYLNNGLFIYNQLIAGGALRLSPTISTIVNMAANDYITIKAYHNYGANRNVEADGSLLTIIKLC